MTGTELAQTAGEPSVLERLDAFRAQADRYNVLTPTITLRGSTADAAVAGELVNDLAIVAIGPDEVYHDFRFAAEQKGQNALNQRGLSKIALAAGIEWIEHRWEQPPTRREGGHYSCTFYVKAGVLQPNGSIRTAEAWKHIDTEDELELYVAEAERSATRKGGTIDHAAIATAARDRMMQLRQFLEAHAQTKAENRAIRKLLNLKQVYSSPELARPFVIGRWIARPGLAGALEASRAVYGSAPELAAGGLAPVEPTAGSADQPSNSLPAGPPTSDPAVGTTSPVSPEAGERRSREASGRGDEARRPGNAGRRAAEDHDDDSPPTAQDETDRAASEAGATLASSGAVPGPDPAPGPSAAEPDPFDETPHPFEGVTPQVLCPRCGYFADNVRHKFDDGG